jgi:predicted TIM-barrel fold metal-dependent hydrolase
MRYLGHTIQVISHIPISVTPQICSKLNDALETGTRLQSDKLVALALLPGGPGEGRDAAADLQRCVTKMKFIGGVIAVGRGAEDGSFEEVWSVAQRLGVPIVLREEWPSGHQVRCVFAMRTGESRLTKRTLTVADQRVYAGLA